MPTIDEYENILQNNGFFGSINPLPFIIETPKFEFTYNLYLGKSGEDVRNLQIALAYEGFLGQVGFSFTSYFGMMTREAIIRFQIKYGIIGSRWSFGAGFCGPKTRAKLNEIFK